MKSPGRKRAFEKPILSALFYDSQDIVFSRSPGTRGHYQFSSWTEAPARRLNAELLARLERGGAFASVAAANSGVRGELLLRTQVDEIYHDAVATPGTARVLISAELSDRAKNVLLARRSFSAEVPVASYDADGAVRGLGLAAGLVLDEISAWTVRSSPP